jgi:hypothetical protein
MSAADFVPDSSDAVAWYEENADAMVERHESLAPEKVNAWLPDVMPNQPALLLDVGAGSGRDEAWLASRGHEVIAVKPSEQMRHRGERLHRADKHLDELEQLARIHGTFIERVEIASDELARAGVGWTRVIVRLPDDGTGALPVIRHIILKDSKSSTYKLALLRVLARIAAGSLGLTRSVNEESVAVALGLVAVFWLRQFKMVLQAGLPQMPTNRGLDGLGFVKDAY